MKREWNNFVIISLSITLIFSVIGNIYLVIGPEIQFTAPVSRTLNIGTHEGPSDLDPIHSWDISSNHIIEQVCEGLFMHDLSDPNLKIVPRLAANYGTWDSSATHFTVQLRQNVFFHDGTKFNASSVKWTFERINYFINASGMPWVFNESYVSKIHSLYEFSNGTTILDPVNPVTINSEFSVTINLRGPFAILESILCYVTAYMLSPASTPQFELVDTAYGRIVGTGPFVFNYYVVDIEVSLSRWDDYWLEPAFFEDVIFSIIKDDTKRNNAMLDHTIDYLIGPESSFLSTYDSDPTINRKSDIKSSTYHALVMNYKKINKTWRQAISFAINYTHIIEILQEGNVYRSNGPISPNFPMYDPTIRTATWDLSKARQILVDAGITTLTVNNDTTGPIAEAWKAADFKIWNFTYEREKAFLADISDLLQHNLDQIGITVVNEDISFWDCFPNWGCYFKLFDIEALDFHWITWGPDYLSPYNIIVELFSNQSTINTALYHNHDVEMWLKQVLREPNSNIRKAIYRNILHLIVEVDMPHVFGYHPYLHYIHSMDIQGVYYNTVGDRYGIGSLYIYPIYRDPNL
ncbi:MAG: ABC transporter substrate-binding protein [Candidatus Hermodarchaeota archaeon]